MGEEKALGYFDQVIFKGRNSPDDVVWLKINRTTLAKESRMVKVNTAPIIENKDAPREAGRVINYNNFSNQSNFSLIF